MSITKSKKGGLDGITIWNRTFKLLKEGFAEDIENGRRIQVQEFDQNLLALVKELLKM